MPMADSKKRSSRFSRLRFGIRTLIVALTIGSVALAILSSRAQRQRNAVSKIKELGGWVWYATGDGNKHQFDDLDLNFLVESLGPDWFYDVVQIDLAAPAGMRTTKNDDLSMLQHLPKLRTMELSGYNLTDDAIQHFRNLNHLEYCAITSTNISRKGFESLRNALPDCRIP